MRRAAKVDATQAAIVKALRRAGCQVQTLAAIGKGVPDLLVGRAMRLWLLECKTGNGDLTPAQRAWHALWPVHVVRSPEDALRAVGLSASSGH